MKTGLQKPAALNQFNKTKTIRKSKKQENGQDGQEKQEEKKDPSCVTFSAALHKCVGGTPTFLSGVNNNDKRTEGK